MDKFNEFMQNAWIIGIVGGTISGIIVYYITIYVLDRKNKHELRRNITYANNAVLDILRPYIANSGLPDERELDAIINSISRQYNVKRSEMNSIAVLYEDLVVEFISNLYIPDDVKKKNIEKLLENIDVWKNEDTIKSEQEQKQAIKSKTVQTIGILVGTLSTTLSILFGVLLSGNGKGSFNLIVCIISVIVVVIVVIISILSYLRTYRLEKMHMNYANKVRDYFVNKDYIKMKNCGTDLNDSFDASFSFINYFEDDE